ncbi:MAG: 3-isopropylmalate dehydratase small subunit [Dehalococcoidia bacterium]
MELKGKVHKYGANVDTDAIIPARYLNVSNPEELARHCMEDIDAGFVNRVEKGDIIVASTNFGSGSSREHAPLAIKASGISCVIAESFSRIFYRNSLNIGLPILECVEAVRKCEAGDLLAVDLSAGRIRNITKNIEFVAEPYPDFMMELISAGGLIEYTREKLGIGENL